jgi:hypothetical protein
LPWSIYAKNKAPIAKPTMATIDLASPCCLVAAFCNLGVEVALVCAGGATATHEVEVMMVVPPLPKTLVIVRSTALDVL